MPKKTTNPTPEIKVGQTVSPVVTTKEQALNEFVRLAKRDSSCATRIEAFVKLMQDLCNEQGERSFSWLDVLRESNGRNVEIQCLDSLFDTWIQVYVSLGKVQALPSCYDYPIYQTV